MGPRHKGIGFLQPNNHDVLDRFIQPTLWETVCEKEVSHCHRLGYQTHTWAEMRRWVVAVFFDFSLWTTVCKGTLKMPVASTIHNVPCGRLRKIQMPCHKRTIIWMFLHLSQHTREILHLGQSDEIETTPYGTLVNETCPSGSIM